MKKYAKVFLKNDSDENFYLLCESNGNPTKGVKEDIFTHLDWKDLITGEVIYNDFSGDKKHLACDSFVCVKHEDIIDELTKMDKKSRDSYVGHISKLKSTLNSSKKRVIMRHLKYTNRHFGKDFE